jgi:hypothetical protein
MRGILDEVEEDASAAASSEQPKLGTAASELPKLVAGKVV